MLSLDLSTLKEAAMAVALGLMMGLERERSGFDHANGAPGDAGEGAEGSEPKHGSLGARTFALLTLLGWVSVKVGGASSAIPIAVLIMAAGLIGLFYFETTAVERGLTTEVAAISAPLLGMLLTRDALLAVAVSVIVTLLLLSKPWFRAWIPRLHREDLTAAMQLLILFVILLPLLPVRTMDPWAVLSPRKVGWMVALIASVDFLGYALNRTLGAKRGILFTGLVGGLVSSTVVTLTMSRQARQDPSLRGPSQIAVLLACAVMNVRVGILATLVGGVAVVGWLLLPLGAMMVVLLGAAAWIYRSSQAQVGSSDLALPNPFHLKRAVAWGLALAAVLLISAAARAEFGTRGLLVTAGISGLADVAPITLAVSSQVGTVGLSTLTAVMAIVVAIGANTLVKGALAWISGGRAFGKQVVVALAASMAVALGVLWLQR